MWSAAAAAGAPVPICEYVVEGEFPRLRPGVNQVPAAFDAARDLDPIRLRIPVSVVTTGSIDPARSPEAAIDLLLADSELVGWLAAHPGAWPAARLVYQERRWELLRVADGRLLIGALEGGEFAVPSVRFE